MTDRREASDRKHFDAIAEHYGAKDLAPSCRPARRRRLERTIDAVPGDTYDRVLEVGCGAGYGAHYLRGRFRHYTGIDHSQRLIEFAVANNSAGGVRFEESSIAEFEPSDVFDLIFMIGVLHHLEDAAGSLDSMVQWLRPGGYLVANEPSPENPLVHGARLARERLDHAYSSEQEEISAAGMRSLLGGAGLHDVTVTPQGFFSTPFAEVVLKPFLVTAPLARAACVIDGLIEAPHWSWLEAVSWNLIACGRAPAAATG
jgi:SAM-dependent methyltransferase